MLEVPMGSVVARSKRARRRRVPLKEKFGNEVVGSGKDAGFAAVARADGNSAAPSSSEVGSVEEGKRQSD